jgi:hypothetical protein
MATPFHLEGPPEPACRRSTCFARLAPLAPGAQGVIYDTALRGTHHQRLLRDLGLLPVNRVTAAKAGAKTPRRKDGQREKKSVHLEDKTVTAPDGTRHHLRLYARGGDLSMGAHVAEATPPEFASL